VPPRSVMSHMFSASGSKRIYLYCLNRLMDLVRRHGRSAWHLLWGHEAFVRAASQANEDRALREWFTLR